MEVIWVVAFVVLALVALFFIFMYFRATLVLVRPADCLASTGLYGVTPATTGIVLNICGATANANCSFDAGSLLQAIAICDDDKERCRSFIYTQDSGRMSYIDFNKPISSAGPSTNLYQRRYS